MDNTKIFASIKTLFEGNNTAILDCLLKKEIKSVSLDDLIACGFKDDNIIKSSPTPDAGIWAVYKFWPETHYKGLTLKLEINEYFAISENNNSAEKADLLNQLRNKTYDLECTENGVWAYRNEAELEDENMAQKLELKAKQITKEIELLKSKINSI